jgi:hypothetical protein
MGQDLHRLASEQHRRDAASAMRGHDDEVALLRFGNLDDDRVWLIALAADRLEADAGRSRSFARRRKRMLRTRLQMSLKLRAGILDLFHVEREDVERFGDD